MGFSLGWSPDPLEGLIRLQNGFTLFVLYLYFSRHGKVPWDVLAWAGIALSLIRPDIYGGLGNTIFQYEYLLLLVPWCRWWTAVSVFVFLGVFDGATLSSDGGSSIVWPALWIWCVWQARRVSLYTAVFVAVLPAFALVMATWGDWSVLASMERSAGERLELWFNTSVMLMDGLTRVMHGVGIGGFMYWYPFYQEAHLEHVDSTMLHGLTFFVNAAHNDWLQLLAVFGFVGFGLAVCVVWSLCVQGVNTLFLLVTAGLMFLNFPMQNPASAAVIVMGCGVINALASARSVRAGRL
jgi:hypothetical protein